MALDPSPEFNKMRKQSYALSHSWDLVIPPHVLNAVWGFISEGKKNILSLYGITPKNPADGLNLRCKSSGVPKSTVRTEKVKVYGMSTQVILEDDTEGSITLVFLEDGNHDLYRLFSVWKDIGASHRTYAIGGRGRDPFVAQDDVKLRLLQPDAKSEAVRLIFILYGVQPTKVELSNLDNNINFITLTVTLKYDNFEVL